MSKVKCCVPSDNPKLAACGAPFNGMYRTAYCKEAVTCKKCRKTKEFKTLKEWGKLGL